MCLKCGPLPDLLLFNAAVEWSNAIISRPRFPPHSLNPALIKINPVLCMSLNSFLALGSAGSNWLLNALTNASTHSSDTHRCLSHVLFILKRSETSSLSEIAALIRSTDWSGVILHTLGVRSASRRLFTPHCGSNRTGPEQEPFPLFVRILSCSWSESSRG